MLHTGFDNLTETTAFQSHPHISLTVPIIRNFSVETRLQICFFESIECICFGLLYSTDNNSSTGFKIRSRLYFECSDFFLRHTLLRQSEQRPCTLLTHYYYRLETF